MSKPIKVEIIGDNRDFNKAIDEVGDRLSDFGKKLAGVLAIKEVGEAVGRLGADAVSLASDLGEAQGAAEQIFGTASGDLVAGFDDAARAMGMNRVEALDLANGYGVLFKDLTAAERATATLDATARAADVGSMFNDDPAAVAAAFTSAINGSSETVRKYGIDTSDAALKQYALEQGIGAANGALTEAEKKLIRHQIIMRDSEIAAGNFADTSTGLANQQRIAGAMFDELKIKLGEKLLPVVVSFANFATGTLLPGLERLGGYVGEKLGPVFGALGDFFAAEVLPRLATVGDWFETSFTPNLEAARTSIAENLQPTVAALTEYWDTALRPALIAVGAVIRDDVLPILSKLAEYIVTTVVPFVLQELLPALIKFQTIMLGTVVPAIAKVVAWVVEKLVPVLVEVGGVAFTIGTKFVAFATTVVGQVNRIVTTITGMPGRVRSAATGMWDGIRDAFRSAINWIIDRWNSLSFSLPSVEFLGQTIGGGTISTPNIGRLITGTGHSQAGEFIVGEAGPERVTLPTGSRVDPTHRTSTRGDITVNVYDRQATGEDIARAVAWASRTKGI